MTRDEAEALIRSQPGVCVATTWAGVPVWFGSDRCLIKYRRPDGVWWTLPSAVLPHCTYTRVKAPELCRRAG